MEEVEMEMVDGGRARLLVSIPPPPVFFFCLFLFDMAESLGIKTLINIWRQLPGHWENEGLGWREEARKHKIIMRRKERERERERDADQLITAANKMQIYPGTVSTREFKHWRRPKKLGAAREPCQ